MATPVTGDPSLSEVVRRVERVEDRLDARTLTTDVWSVERRSLDTRLDAMERSFTAQVAALQAAVNVSSSESREAIRSAHDRIENLHRILIGTFLLFLVNLIGGVILLFAKAGP